MCTQITYYISSASNWKVYNRWLNSSIHCGHLVKVKLQSKYDNWRSKNTLQTSTPKLDIATYTGTHTLIASLPIQRILNRLEICLNDMRTIQNITKSTQQWSLMFKSSNFINFHCIRCIRMYTVFSNDECVNSCEAMEDVHYYLPRIIKHLAILPVSLHAILCCAQNHTAYQLISTELSII